MMLPAILACLLSHNSFTVRESAETALAQMGGAALPALAWAAESADPEVSARAARLLAAPESFTVSEGYLLGRFAGLPYCDSMPNLNLYDWQCRAREELAGHLPTGSPLWLHQRHAVRLWLEESGPQDMLTLSLMAWRSMHYDRRGCYP